jgi:hypothetical protein
MVMGCAFGIPDFQSCTVGHVCREHFGVFSHLETFGEVGRIIIQPKPPVLENWFFGLKVFMVMGCAFGIPDFQTCKVGHVCREHFGVFSNLENFREVGCFIMRYNVSTRQAFLLWL